MTRTDAADEDRPEAIERVPPATGRSFIDRLVNACAAPVDAASAVVFRIGFGLIMAWWCFDELRTGRVRALYVVPPFHFTYYPFDFIHPCPGQGMTVLFLAMLVLALCVAAGWFYRTAQVLFALGFTYVFLLDRTSYQNHYYLLTLVSWTLAILPLGRCGPRLGPQWIDRRPRSETLPPWSLWLLRFHIALPYVFGGLAKLQGDWLAGEPLRTHFRFAVWNPALRPLLASEPAVALFTWGGLLFDLAIVPLLLWRPTRIPAYVLCVAFHLMNAFLFQIHVFPWFMIFATTIFFEPDWPRRMLRRPRSLVDPVETRSLRSVPARSRLGGILLGGYCLLQLALPFRHFLYAGNANWTERGHCFSWHMMLRVKESALRYYVTDPAKGVTTTVDLRRYVDAEQLSKFSRDPEMILHLAHHLAEERRRETGRDVEVHALVLTTLNGRKPELLIDPNVDLAKEPRGFFARSWIMPQREPLRAVAWSVPMLQWERFVRIPPLRFLEPRQATALSGDASSLSP